MQIPETDYFLRTYSGSKTQIPEWVHRTKLIEEQFTIDGKWLPQIADQILYERKQNELHLSVNLSEKEFVIAKRKIKNLRITDRLTLKLELQQRTKQLQYEVQEWEYPLIHLAEEILHEGFSMDEEVDNEETVSTYEHERTFKERINHFFKIQLEPTFIDKYCQPIRKPFKNLLDLQHIFGIYGLNDEQSARLSYELNQYMRFKAAAINEIRRIWPLLLTITLKINEQFLDSKVLKSGPKFMELALPILRKHKAELLSADIKHVKVTEMMNQILLNSGLAKIHRDTAKTYLEHLQKES